MVTGGPLGEVSPIDGRYRRDLAEVFQYCSEFALLRYRVFVETRYLEAFASAMGKEVDIDEGDISFLKKVAAEFDDAAAAEVKAHEEKVGHDVVAVVEYLKYRCRRSGHGKLSRYIHFGLTSDDVNNLAYSLMLKDVVMKAYVPALISLCRTLSSKAGEWKDVPMLGHTHGQPASPTTMGKEVANYLVRLSRLGRRLSASAFPGKLTGAVGNFSALQHSFPEKDWVGVSVSFVRSLGLRPDLFTTQVLPHDDVGSLLEALATADKVVQNLDVDVWLYCTLGYLKLRNAPGQVGSSTMPHKVNPIDFENSEGNAKMGASMLDSLRSELEMSRLQRDLSDSTLKRNYGVAIAHSLLAVKKAGAGFLKVDLDQDAMREDLDRHAEVLGEALQHSLRKAGREAAFDEVMALLKGKALSVEEFRKAVRGSPLGEDAAKLLKLKPADYVGLAPQLVDKALALSAEDLTVAEANSKRHVPLW